MKKSKYIGMIIEERWKVLSSKPVPSHHTYYLLENIYNGQQIELGDSQLRAILTGKTTVSRTLYYRINKYDFKRLSNRVIK